MAAASQVTNQSIIDSLQTVVVPHTGQDFVSSKSIKNLLVEGGKVAYELELG